jgi:hypothetical protein
MLLNKKIYLLLFLPLFLVSCVPQVELTSSWTNKTATPKKMPRVMVMALGKNLNNRQAAENYLVTELNKTGTVAIASLDIFKPNVQKYDSVTMVNMLREKGIDMLLTNAVVDVKETQRYVPGTTEYVPVTNGMPANGMYYNGGYNNYYNGYYNYYNNMNTYYYTTYETRENPGYTVTDVNVIIESNLYDVATTELLWMGQSTAYTKEPTESLFEAFAKAVVGNINKNGLLQK